MINVTKDSLNRPLRDVRISVTDQCNFRCSYCMPSEIFDSNYHFLPQDNYLLFSEIYLVVNELAKLGVEKIRLTGGEPLLRKNLYELIEKLGTISQIRDIAMTTNAVMLPKYAKLLKKAGLKRVNVSMDAIDEDIFKKMNGRSIGIKPILNGIDAAKAAGLDVKINAVIQRGVNDQQIIPLAAYFKNEGITVRFIEFMDVGTTNGWKLSSVVTKQEIIEVLNQHFSLEPITESYFGEVAKRFRYTGSDTEIGIIPSVSESFCSSCTRARISADGKFFTCLFATKGFDLKALLRSNATQAEIGLALQKIWHERRDRYSDERTEETAKSRKKIEMSYIGG